MTLQEFVDTYKGVSNVGNTPENKGQCVGLVAKWWENLGKTHIWGHARDLFNNAPAEEWEKILNAPDKYPSAGDIMCWNSTWGGGYGHTGVILSSDPSADSFTCFEQNFKSGEAPTIYTRTQWGGVIGWLRPKGYSQTPTCEEKVKELEAELDDMQDSRNKWRSKYETEVPKLVEEIATWKKNYETMQETNATMSMTITTLQQENTRLNNDIVQANERSLKYQDERDSIARDKRVLESTVESLGASLRALEEELKTERSKVKTKLLSFTWWDRFFSLFRR